MVSATAAVSKYIEDRRDCARKELEFYSNKQRSFRRAVELAALSRREDGNRTVKESHQRRIPVRALQTASRILVAHARDLQGSKNFEALHNEIGRILRGVRGIGALAIYDFALRVGAYLGLPPRYVYLHAGTKAGARKLKLPGWNADKVRKSALPRPFKRLTEAECENCLCIYFGGKSDNRSRRSTCI